MALTWLVFGGDPAAKTWLLLGSGPVFLAAFAVSVGTAMKSMKAMKAKKAMKAAKAMKAMKSMKANRAAMKAMKSMKAMKAIASRAKPATKARDAKVNNIASRAKPAAKARDAKVNNIASRAKPAAKAAMKAMKSMKADEDSVPKWARGRLYYTDPQTGRAMVEVQQLENSWHVCSDGCDLDMPLRQMIAKLEGSGCSGKVYSAVAIAVCVREDDDKPSEDDKKNDDDKPDDKPSDDDKELGDDRKSDDDQELDDDDQSMPEMGPYSFICPDDGDEERWSRIMDGRTV